MRATNALLHQKGPHKEPNIPKRCRDAWGEGGVGRASRGSALELTLVKRKSEWTSNSSFVNRASRRPGKGRETTEGGVKQG